MSSRYPHVFSPIKIGPVDVRNRVYMPPHGLLALVAGGPHGSLVPSDQMAEYFAERAENGVGLLFHSLTAPPRVRMSCALYEESIPAFRAVADMVHRHGAKIMAQLHYVDRHSNPWDSVGGMAPTFGPSERQRWGTPDSVREISRDEIQRLLDYHARCARNLAEAGYDGIEIHTSHGTLHEQFLSPYFNRRTDEYGGDWAGRLRFLVETLQTVTSASGSDMAIGLRLNVDELIPRALTIDDTRRVIEELADRRLIHFADLDIAVEPQQQHNMTNSFLMPPLYVAGFVSQVREAGRGKIVMMGLGGRIINIAQAEQLLADDAMDMVGVVRELLAEPELLKNAQEGHEERSRVCVAHNFCIARTSSPLFGCLINPASGREGRWGVKTFTPAERPGKVVVVGGGPAGLEAARVAALRGHSVVLLEERAAVGGQLNLWASTPRRDVLRSTVEWYRGRLAELGVTVGTGISATLAEVLAEHPDTVMIATGSRYDAGGDSAFLHGAIPGSDGAMVFTPEQILEGGERPTGRVLILDEQRNHAGPAIAELLARAGAQVEIVCSAELVLGEWVHYGGLEHQIIPTLHELGIKLTPEHYIGQIGAGRVTLFHTMTEREQMREVDAVVLLTMRRAQGRALERELIGKVEQVYSIGDAAAPRGLFEAVYDGQRFGRLAGESNAPRTTSEALFSPVPDDAMQRSAASLLQLVS